MRRAASYAVDRSALAATGGSFTTAAAPAQMDIPPGIPGYRDAHVYPLVPDLASARRLAGSGHHDAELYCVLEGGGPQAAQIIKNNLAAIGIDVHVHCMPGDGFFTRMFRPNEPWDIAIDGYGANYNDPGEFINGFATDDEFNFTHYHDPRLSRGSAPPPASPAFPAPRPTPRSTWRSRETPCRGSTSPTSSNRTSSPPASAASSTSRWSAWISAPSASGLARTRPRPAPTRLTRSRGGGRVVAPFYYACARVRARMSSESRAAAPRDQAPPLDYLEGEGGHGKPLEQKAPVSLPGLSRD